MHDTLAERIDPWLNHMHWRKDFLLWRQKRLQQELYQHEALGLLCAALGLAGWTMPQTSTTHRTAGTAKQGNSESDTIPDLSGLHMLDLGCGMGGFVVAAMRAGAQVVALDYNPAYAEITTLRAAQYSLTLPVAVAAGEAVPLPAQSFDVVTCWDVLEHVQSPELLLAELIRVLRVGGVLVLTVINRYAFRDPHYHLPLINWMPRPLGEAIIALAGRHKQGTFRDRQRLSSMHYFTWAQLQRLANRHGLWLYDLDALRVAQDNGIASRKQQVVRKALSVVLTSAATRRVLLMSIYYLYRTVWQATWRVALIKVDP